MKDWYAIWTFVSTILALAVGWGFTQASAWLTLKEADRRVRRETLYFLLELYHQFIGLKNFDKASRLYTDPLLAHFGAGGDEAIRAELSGMNKLILRTAANPILLEKAAALKTGYHASLLKLAAVDPLNASLLRGLEGIIDSIDRTVRLMQNPQAEHGLAFTALDIYQSAKVRQYLEDKLLPNATELLASIIRDLAKETGDVTSQQINQVLAKRVKTDAQIEETVREMMNDLPAIIR